MKQLVKLMDDVNGEVLPPIKFFLKTYTKNLTSPYLEEYARQHGLRNIRHFSDDGYSGTNFVEVR